MTIFTDKIIHFLSGRKLSLIKRFFLWRSHLKSEKGTTVKNM